MCVRMRVRVCRSSAPDGGSAELLCPRAQAGMPALTVWWGWASWSPVAVMGTAENSLWLEGTLNG